MDLIFILLEKLCWILLNSNYFGSQTYVNKLFCDFRKKNPIYKHVSEKCLSSSSSICVLAPAYISLRRDLEYLLKVKYIILVDPNGARFLVFETVFLDSLKKYHKNERNLRLVTYTFTKLSQNVCLINTQILIYIDMPYVTASYGTPFDFIVFFRYFHIFLTIIHVWSIVSSPNFHRLCV